MKKYLLVIIICLLCIGCGKKEEVIKEKEDIKEEVVEDSYKDLNNTPIGLYRLSGNKLVKVEKDIKKFKVEEDIGIYQVYFSNDKEIDLNKGFADSYYDLYNKYNVKVGFNIKFKLKNGEDISYNILNPSQTFDKWEYLMNYLYDDYANKGKSFYSHIEENQYNDSTLFTAIKLQSSYQCDNIDSNIILSVFTYDSEDDFLDGEYRGNSLYSTKICQSVEDC